jgi:hypothetical protein
MLQQKIATRRRRLDTLLALNGVGESLIGLGNRVSTDQASNGFSEELQIVKRVVSLDSLVQVGVESDLLDVLGVTELNESFAGSIVGVEHLLESVEDEVSGSVCVVVLLDVGLLDLGLGRQAGAVLHERGNFLSCHTSRLGGEVDTFSRALGHISSGITDKSDTSLDTSGAVVFGDGVGLNLDNLSSRNLVTGTVADGLLVLLDSRAVHNSSSSDTDVVVLGEDPSVKVGRDVVTDIHLSHLFVELHLLVGDLDTLLESNSKVVLPGIHGLGNTRVCTVTTDDEVDIHGLRGTSVGSYLVLLVTDGVLFLRSLVVGGDVDAGNKTVDGDGTILNGAVAKELVEDFTTAHANVFVGLQSITNVHFDASG